MIGTCEICSKETESMWTIDVQKGRLQPDYYDACESCFDEYVKLVRDFVAQKSKGE